MKGEKVIGTKRKERKTWRDPSKEDPRIPTVALGFSGQSLAPES